MEHIQLPVFDDAGNRVSREVLEVEAEGAGRHRLLHSPAFVDGIARDDIIALDADHPCGFSVVERGGYLAVVLALPTPEAKADAARKLGATITALQGVCEGGPGRLLVFSVPASGGLDKTAHFFNEFCASASEATWWFGNVYEPGTETPLNWWT